MDFFAALVTDDSPVTISENINRIHVQGFWKFNSSFLSDQSYVTKKVLFKPLAVNKILFRMLNESENF